MNHADPSLLCVHLFWLHQRGGFAAIFITAQRFALLQVVRTDAEGSPVQKHPADAADAWPQKLQHRPPDFRAALRVPGVLQ